MPALNIVQLTVNNEPIGIKPNSFSFTDGRGDRTVRTKMSGNNSTTIASTDVETAISMCKFSLIMESSTPDTVIEWRDNIDANVVVAQDSSTGKTYTFNRAIITTSPEFAAGADAEVEIEFQSARVVKS